MRSSFRAVVFDMDGVLVDSEPLHGHAWTEVLTPLGVPLADDWFVEFVGIPDHTLIDRVLAGHAAPISKAELLARKRSLYQALVPVELKAFPGVIEGMGRLSKVVKGIATSSGRTDVVRCLTTTQLLDHFPVIVSGDDVPRHKPDPLPYLRAAELLGVPPETCLVVEDSPAGVAAARGAGCSVIAVTTGHTAESLMHADSVLATMADAMTYVSEAMGV